VRMIGKLGSGIQTVRSAAKADWVGARALIGIAFLVLGTGLYLLSLHAAGGQGAGTPGQPNLMERLAALEGTVAEQAAEIAGLTAALEAEVASREQGYAELSGQIAAHTHDWSTLDLTPFSRELFDPEDPEGGYNVTLAGANLRLRNGLGQTWTRNGLGNLIVGYDEFPDWPSPGDPDWRDAEDRVGSHNIVVGPHHGYTSWGGLLAGALNYASGQHASVSGGYRNCAEGYCASVSGGLSNTATASYASVTGGSQNRAEEYSASVSGGSQNTASAQHASVSGGSQNTASYSHASVSGGCQNTAESYSASVSGGGWNVASGSCASVSGGDEGEASGYFASVTGGFQNAATTHYASVSGGFQNTASGMKASVSGGQANTASGLVASVSGGLEREADGDYDWRAGGLFEDD
jgi:hypothetical protein